VTKCTPERAADIIEMVGADRMMANSAGDWGKSDPMAVPLFIQEMKRRGHSEEVIRKIVFENPLTFFRQSRRWQDWDVPNSVQRSAPISAELRAAALRESSREQILAEVKALRENGALELSEFLPELERIVEAG
jgi:hypothetical protein